MQELPDISIRMKRAIDELKRNKGMLQKTIADAMGISEVSFSRGLKRIANKFDADFIISFNQATGNYFNIDWLLYGKGEMYIGTQSAQEPMKSVEVGDDKDETIKGLRSENMALINTINKLIDELAAMRGEINAIKAHINIQTYHVASGDVNPAALNDELKKYK